MNDMLYAWMLNLYAEVISLHKTIVQVEMHKAGLTSDETYEELLTKREELIDYCFTKSAEALNAILGEKKNEH